MEVLSNLSLLLGSSWMSGVNLYLTIAALGIVDRMGLINLPGNLDAISHPLIISVAVLIYLVEFVSDKIPYVDSAWDSVHTFIRPLGGAALAYAATADIGPAVQIPIALLSGAISMESHLTKATARLAINTSPEPITNSVASVTEDGLVIGVLWLIIQHPIIASVIVVLFILISAWFLKKMFRFLKKVFRFFTQDKNQEYLKPTS
jgi:hypothetical protein